MVLGVEVGQERHRRRGQVGPLDNPRVAQQRRQSRGRSSAALSDTILETRRAHTHTHTHTHTHIEEERKNRPVRLSGKI